MKSNYSKLLVGLLLFLSCLCLSSCKIMTPSDYKKAKEVVTEVCNKNDLHGKVSITKLSWFGYLQIILQLQNSSRIFKRWSGTCCKE